MIFFAVSDPEAPVKLLCKYQARHEMRQRDVSESNAP
jgi:hypothetical protein